MRLFGAMLLFLVLLAPPGAAQEDGDEDGCTINLSDPTRPGIYGDCTELEDLETAKDPENPEVNVRILGPEGVPCVAFCAAFSGYSPMVEAGASLDLSEAQFETTLRVDS